MVETKTLSTGLSHVIETNTLNIGESTVIETYCKAPN